MNAPVVDPGVDLAKLVARAKGEKLYEAELRLVHIAVQALHKLGESCIGDTVVAGLDDGEDAAYVFTEAGFQRWLRDSQIVGNEPFEPMESSRVRIVIIFPSGFLFSVTLVHKGLLN